MTLQKRWEALKARAKGLRARIRLKQEPDWPDAREDRWVDIILDEPLTQETIDRNARLLDALEGDPRDVARREQA